MSRLVLPFWYRFTQVVLDKAPLNGCLCVCVCVCVLIAPCSVNGAGEDVHRCSRSGPGGERGMVASASLSDTARQFSPFPRQYVNKRRLDSAIRLALYTVDSDSASTGPQKSVAGGRATRYS